MPVVIAILGAAWLQRIIDETNIVLRDMRTSLKDLDRRVTIIEERTGVERPASVSG